MYQCPGTVFIDVPTEVALGALVSGSVCQVKIFIGFNVLQVCRRRAWRLFVRSVACAVSRSASVGLLAGRSVGERSRSKKEPMFAQGGVDERQQLEIFTCHMPAYLHVAHVVTCMCGDELLQNKFTRWWSFK